MRKYLTIFLLIFICSPILQASDHDDSREEKPQTKRALTKKEALFKEKFFFDPNMRENPADLETVRQRHQLDEIPMSDLRQKDWRQIPFMYQTHFLLVEFETGWFRRDQYSITFYGSQPATCSKTMINGDLMVALCQPNKLVRLQYGYEITPSDFDKAEKISDVFSQMRSLESKIEFAALGFSSKSFNHAQNLYNIGIEFRNLKATTRASEIFADALEKLGTESSDEAHTLKVKILHNLGTVNFHRGKQQTAKGYFEEASKVHQDSFSAPFKPSQNNLDKLNKKEKLEEIEEVRPDFEKIILDLL